MLRGVSLGIHAYLTDELCFVFIVTHFVIFIVKGANNRLQKVFWFVKKEITKKCTLTLGPACLDTDCYLNTLVCRK